MSLRLDLKKLKRRSRSDRWSFVSAFIWLGLMRAATLLLPFRWLTRLLHLIPTTVHFTGPCQPNPRIDQICWAISAASARTPWQCSCLTRALCGLQLLGKSGLPSTLFLGVAKGESIKDPLRAHAWLNCGDRTVLGERESLEFTPLSAFRKEPASQRD